MTELTCKQLLYHIVNKYQKEYCKYCLLCYSNLSQQEIIDKTCLFYDEYNRIPYPIEIDKHVQYINIQPYIYSQFETKNDKYKFFFTKYIEHNMLNSFEQTFSNTKEKERTKIEKYYEMNKYELTEKEADILSIEKIKIQQKTFTIMLPTEKSLNEKINFFTKM